MSETSKRNSLSGSDSHRIPAVESLVVSDLEIAKALASRGRLRLRGVGQCMAPHVRQDDVLDVLPRTASEITVGDVVVFRRADRFFAHRAIEKGIAGEGAYVVTRSDRAGGKDDGPSFDQDILGVVARTEKNAARLFPRWLPAAVTRVQGTPVYRLLASWWLARRRTAMAYSVYAPLHAGQRCDVYRKLSLAEFAAMPLQPEPGGVDRWSLLAWIGKGNRPAASLEIAACPAADSEARWTIVRTETRFRFRCTGIDNLVYAKADELLAQRGMGLRASVHP